MTDSENIYNFPGIKAIEEEAARWIMRIDEAALSEEEQDEFREWLATSVQHREALDRMAAIWAGADSLAELKKLGYSRTGSGGASSLSAWWRPAAAAAVILLMFTLVLFRSSFLPGQHQSDVYMTRVGEQRTIELVDGSRLILNTDTAVEVEISPDLRDIHLLRGEAYFEVASDKERPFKVYVGQRAVRAVGTAFTVFVRKKKVEVTVTEGVVELLAGSAPAGEEAEENKQPDQTPETSRAIGALVAGQNALFDETIESLQSMSDEALGRKLMWRKGFVAFSGESLSSVVQEVSRYTDVTIEIDDPALEQIPIGGYFKVGDLESLFEALENVFHVRVSKVSDDHVKLTRTL